MKLVLLLMFILMSCVGTLEDNGKKDDSTVSSPNQDFIFNGAEQGIAVSNTRLAVRFFPALGGSGNFRYQLLDEGGNVLTGEDGNNLVKDSNGMFHLSHAGFVSGTSNRVLVRAIDIDREIPDVNNNYVTVALPAGDYPEFNGVKRCEAFPGANGATQLNVFWDQGRIIPDAFFGFKHNSVGSYKVYYCEKSLGTNCLFENTPNRGEINVTNPFDTQLTVAGLLPNSKYYFRTTALSVGDLGAGIPVYEEENIEFAECQTEVSSGPIVFTGITDVIIAEGEDGINEASVEWAQASGGYTGYIVYYHPTIDANAVFNYLDPNVQSVTILDPLQQSTDLVGLDSFTHHAFLVKACPDLIADPNCNAGNDANEKFIIREMKPPVATFAGIAFSTNDVNNPSNVFLNFVPADTSFGGIFDEYRVIISDGTNDYDITNSDATNKLGVLYPSAPSDYLDLYLDGFVETNISNTSAKLNGLKPGVIYQADVQAWVSRTSPLPIQGGNITIAYGTTSTVPVPVSNDDTTAPLASVMTVSPITGTLKETEILRFVLTYNENLVITGTPRIGVDIGGVTKYASMVSNTAMTMTFEYEIQAGDNDLDGIEYDTSTVSLNGGTIADLSGNNANLNFIGVEPPVDSIFVDTIPPNPPTGIAITNDWISAVTVDQMASWTNPLTDFAFAEVGIGSNGSGTANTVAFTNAIAPSNHTFFALNTGPLIECNVEYQVMVRSVDAAGLFSTVAASAQTFKFDETAPTQTTVNLVGTTNDIFVANEVSWGSTSDNCGPIDHYEIAIGYDDDGGDGFGSDDLNNVLDWSEVPGGSGTVNYKAQSGVDGMTFTLNASEDFYVSIRAVDEAGNPAAPASSGSFQVDIAGPSTPSSLAITSNWISGALPLISPTVSWTNPGDPDFNHIKIALGSSIGLEDIESLLNIGTFTSYAWPSLNAGIVDCNKNYPKVIAYDTIGNPSIAATDPNVWVAWDNVAPTFAGGDVIDISAGGEALPGTAPIANWSSTTRTDNCNTISHYEISVGFDDDADGFDAGDVDNLLSFTEVPGGNTITQYQIVDGVDGFSLGFVGSIDYYVSLRIVDEAGNISTEITSSTPFMFIDPPDQIATVEPAEIGVTQIELGWVEPNDNGTAITDYIIEYKETSSGTWLTYADGISNDPRVTVTGLTALTEYDFRVTAFNGSYSPASAPVTEKTFPNHPFFNGSENAALNLGGSTDSKIVALENGVVINLNGVNETTLNKGEVHQLATVQNDVLTSTKKFFVAGRRGAGGATSKGNIVWNVAAWAGREFLFNGSRDPAHIYTVFSFEDTNLIEVYRDGTLETSITINEDDFHTFTLPNDGSYHVISTGVITGYVYSEDAAANRVIDPYPVMPLSKDIIGYQSGSGQYNVVVDNTSYEEYQSNSASPATGTFSNSTYTSLSGGGSFYTGEVSRVIGQNEMTARSTADGNGNCSASHIPMIKMRKNYAINIAAEYIAFGSDKPAVITYREPGGSNQTLTLTKTGGHALAPYKGRLVNLAEGTTFESNERIGAWYEPSNDNGGSNDDETLMYGFD